MFASDDGYATFLREEVAKEKLTNTLFLKDAKADNYDPFLTACNGPAYIYTHVYYVFINY